MINQIRTKQLILLLLGIVALVSCKQEKDGSMVDNVLLKEWKGLYGGIPAFDQMKVEDVKSAMLQGMELKLKDIDAIANNREAPTFENTIEELERAGKEIERAFCYYGIFRKNRSTPEFRAIQTELAPLISEFHSKITQNEKLFNRIKAVYNASLEKPLEAAFSPYSLQYYKKQD